MKTVTFTAILIITGYLLLLFFTGCLQREKSISHERGVIIGRHFEDSYWRPYTTLEQYYDGHDYRCCVVTPHAEYIPAKYITIFNCEKHNSIFKIDNSIVYAKLREWDTVVIDYYNMVDNDGNVKDFDFIDANKIVNQNW